MLYSLLANKTFKEVLESIPAVIIDTVQPYKDVGIPLTGIKIKAAPASPPYKHFADTSIFSIVKKLNVACYTTEYYGASFFCKGVNYELSIFPIIAVAANPTEEPKAIADNNFAWFLYQRNTGKRDSIVNGLGDAEIITSHSKSPAHLIKIGDEYFGLNLQNIDDTSAYLYKEKQVVNTKAQYEDALSVHRKNIATSKTGALRNGSGLLLIHFSGSWCIPCREAMPYLKAVYKKYRNRLELVTIQKEQNWNIAWLYHKKNPLAWASFYETLPCEKPDSPDCLAQAFGVNVYPCYILLDENDNVLMKEVSENGLAKIEAYLKKRK